MSQFDGLNDAVYSVFCDTNAVWSHGAENTELLITADIEMDEMQRQIYKISSAEQKAIACPASLIAGMQRKDLISFNGLDHIVMRVHVDSSNWATIIVERVR